MLISPETSQRALLLSKRRIKIYHILFLCLFVRIPVSALDGPVYLAEGPVESSGIPFIYPNAVRVYTGIYRYKESPVKVMFSAEEFIIPEEWEKSFCGGYAGYVFKDTVTDTEAEGTVFFFSYSSAGNAPSWGVFLRFAGDTDCGFISAFIKRFIYLQRDWDPSFPPLMPAVVE